jgi:hypothetical protein
MYKVIVILIFSIFFLLCKQKKSSSKMHLSKENILPKDTSSHVWYPIDLSGTKNVKLCLAYHTNITKVLTMRPIRIILRLLL